MNVVGYADRISVQPGETIKFMVSCKFPSYRTNFFEVAFNSSVSIRGISLIAYRFIFFRNSIEVCICRDHNKPFVLFNLSLGHYNIFSFLY